MKTNFLSTIAAVALLSTSVMAQSYLDIVSAADSNDSAVADTDVAGTVTGAITVASEVLAGASASVELNTTAAGSRSIIYVPDIDMGQQSIIEITVTNGAVGQTTGNQLYLTDGTGSFMGKMTDKVQNTDGDYTWMRFQVTVANGIVSGESVFITEDHTTGTVASGSITVVANKGLTKGDTVTMQVTYAKDDTGSSATSPLTKAETIMSVTSGISALVGADTQIIDVGADRLTFLSDGKTSKASDINVSTGGAEVGLALTTTADKYDLVIERSNCSGLEDEEESIELTVAGTAPTDYSLADCKWHWKGTFGDTLGTNLLAGGAKVQPEITVNGTEILQTGDWTTTLTIQADEILPAGTEVVVLDKVPSHKWGINGAQFIVPYLNTNSAYGTYLVVTNTANKDADISMDVYADNGNKGGVTQANAECTGIALGSIPANSTATYYPADFNIAIDGTVGCANFSTTNDRFLGQFSAVANDNSIHAAAFQKDGANGKRSIPVLTNRNGHSWGE